MVVRNISEDRRSLDNLSIRTMLLDDWEAVKQIYLEGIATGNATFETQAPDWKDWNRSHLEVCRLVAVSNPGDSVTGWAALSPYSSRKVYAGVAEVSIYVAESARGMGIGKKLLTRLIKNSETAGIWSLQAGIFPENSASLSLHQSSGFRVVGRRERIGQMWGTWRDVLLLERRSSAVGI